MDTIPFTPDPPAAIPFTSDPVATVPFKPDAPRQPGLMERMGLSTGEPIDWGNVKRIGGQLVNLKPDIFPKLSPETEKAHPSLSGAYEGVTKSAEGFASPPNLALAAGTAGLGEAVPALGEILKKALPILFGAAATKQAATTLGTEAGTPSNQTTPKQRAENVASGVTDAGLAGLLAGKSGYDTIKSLPQPLQDYPRQTGALIQQPKVPATPMTKATLNESPSEVQGPPPVTRPTVPETPPEYWKGVSVTEEIRQRNLRTKAQIKEGFPQSQLSNEQAARLRDAAWGSSPQQPLVDEIVNKPQPKEENVNARTPQETPVPKGPQAGVKTDVPAPVETKPIVQPQKQGTGEEIKPADAPRPQGEAVVQPQERVLKFTTSKGSTYSVNEDGTTIRNKALRPEHPGEQGPQPQSEATYYVTKEDAQKLGEIQAQGGGVRAVQKLSDGRIGVRYLDGKDAGKFETRTVVTPKTKPSKGLYPVEVWDKGKNVHFGNEITDTGQPQPQDAGELLKQAKKGSVDQKAAFKEIRGYAREEGFTPEEFVKAVQAGAIEHPEGLRASQALSGVEKAMEGRVVPEPSRPVQPIAAPLGGISKSIKPQFETKPLPMGPGASNIAELPSMRGQGPGNPDVYGTSHRVLEEMAKAGTTEPVPRGKVMEPEQIVQRGRELYAKQGLPGVESALTQLESGSISTDSMALLRAHGEALKAIRRQVEEHYGTESPEFERAHQQSAEFDRSIKPGATTAGEIFRGLQGETDLDTGDFGAVRQRFSDLNEGKEMLPRQKQAAERIVKENKEAEKVDVQKQEAVKKKIKQLAPSKEVTVESAKKSIEGYKGGKFDNDQLKALWSRVSHHMEQGIPKDRAVSEVATELGMKWGEVVKGLAQDKEVSRLSDEAWRAQLNRRQLKTKAQRWLLETSEPKLKTVFQNFPNYLFQAKTGFGLHGLVALGTHAPSEIYPAILRQAVHPTSLDRYFSAYGTMWKMFGSPAFFERTMQELKADPLWRTAREGGVQNDPFTVEDFTSPETAKWAQKFTGAGNRGYAVLKVLRQANFNAMWEAIPEELRSTDADRMAMAKALGPDVNHATGTTESKASPALHYALFAPRLGASRVAFLTIDPFKAAVTGVQSLGHTVLGWKDATPAEKVFARNQLKQKAAIAAVYFGLLQLNNSVLTATGSKQRVNFDDPMKGDWLKFKIAGQDVGYGSQFLTLIRLPIRIEATVNPQSRFARKTYPDEKAGGELLDFERTQESPFAGVVVDLALRQDSQGRQLPNSNFPNPKRLQAQDIDKYIWPEWVTQKSLAIPFQEPMEEVWRHGFGLDDQHIERMGSALLKASIMGVTGARISEDYQAGKP